MEKYPSAVPNIEEAPVIHLMAILPHAAGVYAAAEAPAVGRTRDEILQFARMQRAGSWYVSRLVDPESKETVWTESMGWLEDLKEQTA